MTGESARSNMNAQSGSVFGPAEYQYLAAFLLGETARPEHMFTEPVKLPENVSVLPVREDVQQVVGLDMRTHQVGAMVAYLQQNPDLTDAQIKSRLLRRYRYDPEMISRISNQFNQPRGYLSA